MSSMQFSDYVMFCNSTGNQTVNLIPAMQFKIPKTTIFSTAYTEEKGLTMRLIQLLKDKKIEASSEPIDTKEEKNPIALIDKFLLNAKKHEKIIWNVSGGQKIPTIAMQTAFQRRIDAGFKEDILLYVEANPPETWYYDNLYNANCIRTNADITMEDILFLYGYEIYSDPNDKMFEIYPSPSKEALKNIETGRKALKYYMENDYFREAFFRWMKSDEPEIKNKNDIVELVKSTLNEAKPNVKDIKLKKTGYEDLEKSVTDIVKKMPTSDAAEIQKAAKRLKIIAAPEEIFNDYWNSIKREIIENTIRKINFNEIKLLQRETSQNVISSLKKQIEDIGGIVAVYENNFLYKKDISQFSSLKKGNGFLFEWMIAAYLYDEVQNNDCLKEHISQIHWSVKTKRVDSEKKDAELDLIITTKFGTFLTIELKTYDFSGDTAKAKEGATLKKSGPYGRAVIVGPLLRSMVKRNDKGKKEYPAYIDGPVRSQQETAEQNGIEYWYLDELPEKVKQKIFCK